MPLRKAVIFASTLGDNAGSFVNETARTLHVRKIVGTLQIAPTIVALDRVASSLDEVPAQQGRVNDSRSHIALLMQGIGDATGAGLAPYKPDRIVLSFNRDDLKLDPDEALFVNNTDLTGTPSIEAMWNIWYQD